MRYLGLLKADEHTEAGEMPSQDLMERMNTFMEDVTRAGVLLAADGLKPSSEGKRLKLADGRFTVTDGPFTESKELVASYGLFEVATMDEAIQWTQRFLEVLGGGEVELRPIYEASDFPPEIYPPEEAAREEALRQQMQQNAAGKQ